MSLLENGDCRGEIAIIYTGTRSRGALPVESVDGAASVTGIPSAASLFCIALRTAGLADSPGFTFFEIAGSVANRPGDDDAPALKLLGQSRIVFGRLAAGGERLVEMLITKILASALSTFSSSD